RIAVDGSGNAYVTGATLSTNFPTTPGAYQAASGGGIDAFAAKLDPSGASLVYSTYLGGTGDDWGQGIAVDGSGSAYVTGYTSSRNFPTANDFQATHGAGTNNVFVARLDPGGASLVHSTYLGGRAEDLDSDIAGWRLCHGCHLLRGLPDHRWDLPADLLREHRRLRHEPPSPNDALPIFHLPRGQRQRLGSGHRCGWLG